MRDIGIHIQQARQDKSMTQEDLAQAIHTTRQTVSNYETGRSRPDADTLVLLAQVLEVPAEALLYGPGWQRGPSRRQTRNSPRVTVPVLSSATILARPTHSSADAVL